MLNHLEIFVSALTRRVRDVLSVLIGKSFVYSKREFGHHQISFSQEGEDSLLMRIFNAKPDGFYVDVGAHDPQRFSNSYSFYRRGWKGINIDPLPGSKAKFDLQRPRDINLEMGVSSRKGKMLYYSFSEPALNTFDSITANTYASHSKLLAEINIEVSPLRDILGVYLPPGVSIDFLSIDVEGLDLDVLRSNDWARFRPRFVLTEALSMSDICHVQQTDLYEYMTTVGYTLFGKTVNTLFFSDLSPES